MCYFQTAILQLCIIALLLFPFHTEDPCSTKKCPFYSECTLDVNGEAQCACAQRCSLVFDPVCASDGETYPNECVFEITACALNGNLTLLHQGHCSEFFCLLSFTSSFYFSQFILFLLHKLMRHSERQKKCGVFYYSFICFSLSVFQFFSVPLSVTSVALGDRDRLELDYHPICYIKKLVKIFT